MRGDILGTFWGYFGDISIAFCGNALLKSAILKYEKTTISRGFLVGSLNTRLCAFSETHGNRTHNYNAHNP